MIDPVAEKSSFLCTYMSSHPKTLVAYAKWFGKVKEPISNVDMTGIDIKGMNLRCTLKSGQKQDLRVRIEPPFKNYDDVKPRLLEMKAIALEGLGLMKPPVLSKLHIPLSSIQAALGLSVIGYLVFFPRDSNNLVWGPAKWWYEIAGEKTKYALMAIGIGHAFEMAYVSYLSYIYKTGFINGAIYVSMTSFAGFHIWEDIKKRARAARIDSAMKAE